MVDLLKPFCAYLAIIQASLGATDGRWHYLQHNQRNALPDLAVVFVWSKTYLSGKLEGPSVSMLNLGDCPLK